MFLKNKNTIFKIRRSKVTDYAALKFLPFPKTVVYVVDDLKKKYSYRFVYSMLISWKVPVPNSWYFNSVRFCFTCKINYLTIVPTKSDSDVFFCLQS